MKIYTQSLLNIWAQKAHLAYWTLAGAGVALISYGIDDAVDHSEKARKRANRCTEDARNIAETAKCHEIFEEFRSCVIVALKERAIRIEETSAECYRAFVFEMNQISPTSPN